MAHNTQEVDQHQVFLKVNYNFFVIVYILHLLDPVNFSIASVHETVAPFDIA